MGSGDPTEFVKAEDDPIREWAYWNTPLNGGVTRRQRKYADEVGVAHTLAALAVLPCLGGPLDGPCCRGGSCVTCEARNRLKNPIRRGDNSYVACSTCRNGQHEDCDRTAQDGRECTCWTCFRRWTD